MAIVSLIGGALPIPQRRLSRHSLIDMPPLSPLSRELLTIARS
jgi:hypothetical protein